MKTLAELLKEVAASETLQKELSETTDKETLEAFFRKNDCGATADEYAACLNSLNEGAVSDETVEAVAGGCCKYETERINIMDIIQLNKRLMTTGVLESLVKIPEDDDV